MSLTPGHSSAKKSALPINKPFAEWTHEEALQVLRGAVADGPTQDGYDRNRRYVVERDHWQEGDDWMGPRGTASTEQVVLAKVHPQYVPVDTLGEVMATAADALLERRFDLGFPLREPPEDAKSTAGKAAEEAAKKRAEVVIRRLREWGDRRKIMQHARRAYTHSRWACWGVLRAWVPPAKLDKLEGQTPDDGTAPPVSFAFPTGLTLEGALDRIYLSSPEPECCVVYEDPETRDRAAVFEYSYDDDEYVELWWVDAAGVTWVRTLGGSLPVEGELQQAELGGHLPFAQVDADLLITESVRRQQARQNFFESLLVRVGEAAGFPERYTINAKATGIWLQTAPTDGPALEVVEQDGVTWYLHPGERTLGSAITTDLVGITDEDPETGKPRTTTPDVKRFEPTDPDYAIKAAKHARQTIRSECKQGHIEIDGEAAATGWSRVQARARFLSDALNHQGPLEQVIAEVLEVVLYYASLMTAELGDFCAQQRAQVTLRVSPGPVSPEERTAINQQVEAGLMAPETAMALLGIEDVQAESERIRSSPEGMAARLAKQFELLALATGAGLGLLVAARIVGFDEQHIALMQADLEAQQTLEQEDEDVEARDAGDPTPKPQPLPKAA